MTSVDQKMNKQTIAAAERLSKADLRFLSNLLDKAEEEANTEIQIDGDNKAEATLTIKRITRIRLAVIDLDRKKRAGESRRSQK